MSGDLWFWCFLAAIAYAARLYHERLTPMSKPNRSHYKLSEVKSQMEDTLGGSTVEFETDDGQVFNMEHPMFRSSETEAALKPLADNDTEGIAKVLLGDQWDQFVKAGGSASDVNLLMMAVGMNAQDQTQGKSTRFSTYSGTTRKR